jgi:hypothetical protein
MTDLVPEEAIEKAAVGMAGRFRGDEGQWRGYWDAAEVAAKAAAPLILAKAFDDFAVDLDKEAGELSAESPKPGTAAYSVISVLVDVAQDVRARASVLRGEGDRE